jgi:hypothetical protein
MGPAMCQGWRVPYTGPKKGHLPRHGEMSVLFFFEVESFH